MAPSFSPRSVGSADQEALVALGDLGGAVGEAVVHDDHLPVESERVEPLEHLADRRRLVVDGDWEGDARAGRRIERVMAPATPWLLRASQ